MPRLQQTAEEKTQQAAKNNDSCIDNGSESKHGKTSFCLWNDGIISRQESLGNPWQRKTAPLTGNRYRNIINKKE